MRKCRLHNLALEKGLRCDHASIQVYLRVKGKVFCRNFGPHTVDNQEVASIWMSDRRKELRNEDINIFPKLPSKKFRDVAYLWFKLWQGEHNPDGTIAHNAESCYKVKWTLDSVLIPKFGDLNYEAVSSVTVDKWRQTYLDRGLSGTTANRYQAILSSIYSHVDKWVKTERIRPPFKCPAVNPCDAVEMAPTRKRERILSDYEAKKLKLAFLQLNDEDGWEICKMALKSVLSMKDLKALDIGSEINTLRSKTGVPVNIPLTVVSKLNFFGWRTRWRKVRAIAGLKDLEFRDLRKTGINWMKGRHDLKLVSEYAGHASTKTTEKSYTIKQSEQMQPLADDLSRIVDSL